MSGLQRRIAEVQVAFMLLTRLPAGRLVGEAPELAAAKWAFPLAGLVVGGSVAGIYITVNSLGLPTSLAAVLALGVGVLITGGLHEDGLADCADGFGGGHTKESFREPLFREHLKAGARWAAGLEKTPPKGSTPEPPKGANSTKKSGC